MHGSFTLMPGVVSKRTNREKIGVLEADGLFRCLNGFRDGNMDARSGTADRGSGSAKGLRALRPMNLHSEFRRLRLKTLLRA